MVYSRVLGHRDSEVLVHWGTVFKNWDSGVLGHWGIKLLGHWAWVMTEITVTIFFLQEYLVQLTMSSESLPFG